MTKPKILIFSLAYFPFVGGAEVAVKELTDRLEDFDFDLITSNLDGAQAREEQIGRVRVFRIGHGPQSKYSFPWRALELAKQLQRENSYQIVWSVMANQAGMAGAMFKRAHPQIPFLLTLQEGDDLDSVAYNLRLVLPRLYGVFTAPDQIQAISQYLATWAKGMGSTCPVTVIPNGVDLQKFSFSDRDLQKGSEKIVITTSRLVYKNGLDDLIRSLAFLPANVKLQILGVGPEEASLKRLVSGLGMASRASFLGQVRSSEVGQYLAGGSVFVRPSRSEGLGNSFLEAMAAGLPVVGTPVGGIPDFLRHGETGWLCEVNDPRSIAEQVAHILDPRNQDEVKQVIARAERLVRDNYDWSKLAVRFSELFERVLLNKNH